MSRTFPPKAIALLFAVCAAVSSCADQEVDVERSADAVVAGGAAKGAIPPGLPARQTVGLFEDTGATWMKNSGVRGTCATATSPRAGSTTGAAAPTTAPGASATCTSATASGFLPAVQYYQLFGEPGGGESRALAKVQNATTMKGYFGDFKLLMQRAKDFGKPVLVLLEADGFGFLEQQTGSNPNAYAAVAGTGLPELAGLPNTVAGWGLAFLQLRKAVGASNALLGIHISGWASGKDIAYGSTSPIRCGPRWTRSTASSRRSAWPPTSPAQTYDVLVGDPLDRDSDYYRLVQGQNRWWDASDSASISSQSFNRYAEWLRLWNLKAAKRWVLWQIPLGNSNHKNVWNNGGAARGLQGQPPRVLLRQRHARTWRSSRTPASSRCCSARARAGRARTRTTTTRDGQLFMKSRAGAFLNAGGVPLATGGATGSGGAGRRRRRDRRRRTSGTAGRGAPGAAGTTGTGGTGARRRTPRIQLRDRAPRRGRSPARR